MDAVDQSVDKEVENTLAEDLEAVMNSGDEPEEKEPVIEDKIEEAEEEAPEEDVEEADEEIEPETDELVEDEEIEDNSLDAPEHWAAADREMFGNQEPEAQQWLLDRHKAMEGDYTKKNQEIADIRRRGEAVDDALTPYRNEFAQAGLDDAGAIRQLASWHASLRSNPGEAIKRLATMYGADITQTDQSDEFVDPAIASVQKELSELKAQQSRQEQQAQQTSQQALVQKIQEFETATDESGGLKHPHFQAVYNDMTNLISKGLASDLDDAYAKSTAWRPELARTAAVAQKETPAAKPDRKARVNKAKKAASGVKSTGASGEKKSDLSLSEEIRSLVG